MHLQGNDSYKPAALQDIGLVSLLIFQRIAMYVMAMLPAASNPALRVQQCIVMPVRGGWCRSVSVDMSLRWLHVHTATMHAMHAGFGRSADEHNTRGDGAAAV
jgi:hypothetical protein